MRPGNDAPKKELKQPLSTRTLSTREQIILLQGSKLNGCVFPPWKEAPAAEEFTLSGTELFTDTTEFRFGVEQLEIFDGWRRPSDVLSVDGLKAETHQSGGIQPTMLADKKIDLVQDMTSDCSVVASLCAGTARAESGHTRVRSCHIRAISGLTELGRSSHLSCIHMISQPCHLPCHPMGNTLLNCISMAAIEKSLLTTVFQLHVRHVHCMSLIGIILVCYGQLSWRKRILRLGEDTTSRAAIPVRILGY